MISLSISMPGADKTIREMIRLSDEIPKAIKRGMDEGLTLAVDKIREDFLSGHGPFPVSEHRLGERSEQLKRSLHATPAVIRGENITATIESGVRYAGVHEFGMVIYPRTKKYLAFQIEGKWIRAKKVTIPARAPITTGFKESAHFVSALVEREIEVTINRIT